MHKFRFIQVLLEHMSESATSNADVAKIWGVDRAQIGRDKQYIQNYLGEIETAHPLVYKSLLVAAVTYSFLSSGVEVDIDFGENSDTGEPDDFQEHAIQNNGDSAAIGGSEHNE